MRNFSADFRKTLLDENTDEVVVLLMTVTHPSITTGEFRVSSDNATLLDPELQLRGTLSRGQEYPFLPMEVSLPEDGDEVAPTIQITLADVGAALTPILAATIFPAYVKIELVLASTPDVVDVQFAIFQMSSADVRGESVTITLIVDAMASEPYPADDFTPASFPGLWASL